MGALPSRETHRRGLYSHRHGRNRRSEVILIPLTAEFFQEAHCPLFQRLYEARHHRTAKYYYRSVRPASTDWDSDFYCQTTANAYKMNPGVSNEIENNNAFEKSFGDSIEGLYHRLVAETEYCVCETDEEVRQRYVEQLREQQQKRQQQQQQNQDQMPFADAMNDISGSGKDAYISGYRDAMAYMKGKEQHTHQNSGGAHVTSPAAFYLRPIPCAIVSRFEPSKMPSEEGVEFLGSTVKVLGMFGLFPATIPIMMNGETVEQHMLKATMFVDKDVGDQILGNVVMLAVHMYVRQCIEARIRAPQIPMMPFILRTPISNIPMLQFVREMRVRLQSLLDAGTPLAGTRHPHSGLNGGSGNHSSDAAEVYDSVGGKQDPDAFLFEEDVPSDLSPNQLFMDASETICLGCHPNQNTNPDGTLPILMMSGVNVQNTPLKHPMLASVAHVRVPAWASQSSGENPATAGQSNTSQHMSKAALLLARRRGRFRIWVEDGRLCIWSSAAYARRGCLILAQQLALTVGSNALPVPRAWNYRGLLRSGLVVPATIKQNDVFVLAHDIPLAGLYQGDVVRCSTTREIADSQRKGSGAGITPITPCTSSLEKVSSSRRLSNQSNSTATDSLGSSVQPHVPVNYTSNHASNVLLQDPGDAPPGAFWVHVPFDRDSVGQPASDKRRRISVSDVQQYEFVSYKHTNVEEVLLSWIKGISIQTRDASETDEYWVRDPSTGTPVRIDRYVIRRVEHDGIRYFIGVTPRFLGQQRRLERVLVELKAMQAHGKQAFMDNGDDMEGDGRSEDEEAPERAAMAQMFSAPLSMFGEGTSFMYEGEHT